MPQVTRVGDSTSGICDVGCEECPHNRSGQNASGSPNVYINKKRAHRLGDTGSCNCIHGGSFQSTAASKSVFVNGKGLTRVGDSTSCQSCGMPGSHVAGSPNVFCG